MKNGSRTISIAYFLYTAFACAIALAVWRLTDQFTIPLWTFVSLLLLQQLLSQPGPSGHCNRLSGIAMTMAIAGGIFVAGVDGYASRLFSTSGAGTDFLPGLEWCSDHGEHSLFLVMIAILANGAVPGREDTRLRLVHARVLLATVLVFVALAMLFLISIDVAALPTLTDLAIEDVRSSIVATSAPGVNLAINAAPRSTSETHGFIALTLATTTLTLIGLVFMLVTRRPSRMVGVALTIPGWLWLAMLSVGSAHRLSPFLFDAIAESVDPAVIIFWLSACALSAHRLASRANQSQSPGHDPGMLIDASTLVAASYTLYHRRVIQSVIEGDVSLSNLLGSLFLVFIDVAALVISLTSLRNLVARLIGISVRVPVRGEKWDVVVLFVQLVLIGPLCTLAGSVYWIVRAS